MRVRSRMVSETWPAPAVRSHGVGSRHAKLPPRNADHITGEELPTPASLDISIHPHRHGCEECLDLRAAVDHRGEFQQLAELDHLATNRHVLHHRPKLPAPTGVLNIDGRACQARRARICSQFAQWLWFPILISADRTPEFAAGLVKTQAALAYAEQLHEGQVRAADGAPFIVHAIEVGMLLFESGAADEVIAAGVLHDTLEKTDATAYDIYARFGRRVGDIVCAVSHDPGIAGYTRRKSALREQVASAGEDALTVFAADKLSKVRELRLGDSSGTKVRSRKLRHYRLSLAMLQDRLPHSSLVAALAAELDSLSDAGEASARAE